MSDYRFHGHERVTIELDGTFEPDALALPTGLVHDGGRVGLFAFAVEGLRIVGVPLARWSYSELLWRIAVRRAGEPAWWVIACDLEARGPRWAARRYVRYDVRALAVEVTEQRVTSRGDLGDLTIELAAGEPGASATPERRPLFVGADAAWQVPWGDDDTPAARATSRIEVDSLSRTTIGAQVAWASTAIVRRGRKHRCGVARR